MKSYKINCFYKFIPLPDYAELKPILLQAMQDCLVKGTIILAAEGINGSFCGEHQNVANFADYLTKLPPFCDLNFQSTYDDANPFDKCKVKIRKEIVSLGKENIAPFEEKAINTHVHPSLWNGLCSDPEVTLIDNRNDYEIKLGTFKGATNPHTINFRDFPEYIEKNLATNKAQKIALFCTGGIRCEKSVAYLQNLGFTNLYQLSGGILNYLASTKEKDSIWNGYCFVFDNRVAIDQDLQPLPKNLIDKEWKNKHRKKYYD